MKPIFESQPEPNQRVDMSEMTIANMHEDCTKCPVNGELCEFKKNTLKCMMTKKRFFKKLNQIRNKEVESDDDEVDEDLVKDEKRSVADFLNSLASTDTDTEDKDDDKEKEDDDD